MVAYWLSFRVAEHDVEGRSGHDRRTALEEVVYEASGPDWWDATTSFMIFNSDWRFSDLTNRMKAAISQADDVFLIRKLNYRQARICGKVDDLDIFRLISKDAATYLIDITDEEYR